MARYKLQEGDVAFCDGVYLWWNGENWELDRNALGIINTDGTIYYDGQEVDYDPKGKAFITTTKEA